MPNRIHMLVTELEERGLVECRGMPGDLRAYAVRLTTRGEQTLASIRRSARALEDEIFAGLSDQQRRQLGALLLLVAARLKLSPGLDAGYRRLTSGRAGKQAEEAPLAPRDGLMLRRVRLFKDGGGFVLRIMGLELEAMERIPPSPDRLLHARIKELGLSESADLLLRGEELVVKNTRHRWPLP